MSSEHDQITAGCEAWQRLQSQQRTAWADWRAVGKALAIGKEAALVAAKVKTPFGRTYVRTFGAWLREHGLDEIKSAHRYRLLKCVDNIDAIEAWRASLDEKQRDKYNHPDSVWFAWRRDQHGGSARAYTRPYRPPNKPAGGKHRDGYHRPLHFPQDMVRRCGDAMGEVWRKNEFFDVYKLAGIALAAALRNELDLLELLPDPPEQSTRPLAPDFEPDFEYLISKMPTVAKSWLRKHPEFMNDPALNKKISDLHLDLINNKGVAAFSPAYFDALDRAFGFKTPAPAVLELTA